MLYDVIPIDIEIHVGHFLTAGVEADILQQFFKDRKQAARTDVLPGFVHHVSRVRNGLNGAVLKGKEHLVHCQQCLILPGKRIFGLCQDGLEVLLGQALERHMDGEAALELGNQVRHLGHMERTRRDKEHEIRAHRAVLGVDGSLQRRGLTPPQYLEKLGLMEHSVLAAHCVWLTDEDIELLARRGVTVLHNPISNLKLASGIAPVARMLKAGCRITLGTDGVASNNNLNLWEEIKLMPMLQKGNTLDPTVVSPAQTIAAATSAGAKAMGYEDLGLLRPGYLADLILLDLSGAHMCPCNDLESNLVYSAQGSDVALTMVNGKVLYRDGEYTTLDPRLVLERAKKQAEALLDRAARAAAAK